MRSERGFSESVQWALLAPVVVGIIAAMVQTAVWLHARQGAQHAAAAAAEAEAIYQPTSGAGQRAAHEIGRIVGLDHLTVDVDADAADRVNVTVTATYPVFMPLVASTVTERASAIRERIR